MIRHLNSGTFNHLDGRVTFETYLLCRNFPYGTVTHCSRGLRITYSIPFFLNHDPAKASIDTLSRPLILDSRTLDVVRTAVIERDLQYDSSSYNVVIGWVRI